jgi:hypothetical protein
MRKRYTSASEPEQSSAEGITIPQRLVVFGEAYCALTPFRRRLTAASPLCHYLSTLLLVASLFALLIL